MQKLTDKQKDDLAAYWDKYRYQVQAEYGFDLIADGLALRHRAQTDGFWLAKEVLGYRQFAECHRELFSTPEQEGFFVLKDPSFKSFKEFAEADMGLHDRLLFLCRGGFKSTADIVDCIQWILCWSSIRINIMTGTVSLGGRIHGHYKRALYIRDN